MATTRGEILGWAAAYKRNMNGLCQALAWQLSNKFGHASQGWAYLSARAAAMASTIVSKNPDEAPAGAWHYFNQPGNYWHVGLALGAGEMLSATSRAGGTQIGEAYQHMKVHRVRDYGLSGYLGWAHTNGVNDLEIVVPITPSTPASGNADGGKDWYTSTEIDADPGTVYWQMLDIVRGGLTRDQKIVEMVALEVNRQDYGQDTTAWKDKKRGKVYWTLVQKHGNRYHRDLLRRKGFPNGLKEDGIPGPGSQLIEYQTSAWVMNQAI